MHVHTVDGATMNAEVAPLASQRKRRSRWAVAIVVLIAVAGVAALVPVVVESTRETTSAPATVSAERRTITQVVSGSGSTVAADSVTVNPEVSGTITELTVKLGDVVCEGDVLYRISSEDADNALLQADAQLLQAEQSNAQAYAQLDQAESQLYSARTAQIKAQQSLNALRSKPATSTEAKNAIVVAKRELTSAKRSVSSAADSVDSAELGAQVAEANFSAVKRSHDDAADDVDNTAVTAPIDGTITSLPVSQGDYVSAKTSTGSSGGSSTGGASADGATTSGSSSGSSGTSIVISNLTDLAVTASVSEVDVTDLSVGMEATVTIDALSSESFDGEVTAISPNAASSSGVVTYEVEITLATTDERLRPGMTATTDIVTHTADNVVAVPNSAVKSDGTTKYVQVLTNGSATERREVQVGISDDTYTEIVSGLTAGENVVTASASSSSASSDDEFRGPGGGMMMGGPPSGGPGGN